jgi:aspartyl/asparaginyl beta-hydroxylase (cupin superfamily)
MKPVPTDVRALTLSASQALQQGDAKRARELFERATSAGLADKSVWLGLAYACRQLGDRAAKMSAVERVLATDPVNVQALILKGDDFAEAGDSRAAVSFYKAAVKRISPQDRIPAPLQADVARARKACEDHARRYEAYLQASLAEHGFDPARSSARFAHSVDLTLGKKQIYYQQPQHYYFPELPQIQFYDWTAFAWIDGVEAAASDIRRELVGVLEGPNAFSPYVESYSNRPNIDASGMIGNPDWTAFFLWKNGEEVTENARRCPRTLEALKEVPLCRIKGRTPSILFSALRPGARIPPHTGMINTRLICHLPLIVPGNCTLRVGNDTREWIKGKLWAFDDTIEHEAWNRSDRLRVVLIFDIWRPELSAEERGLVAAMIEAVDAYDTRIKQWGD